MLRAVFLLMLLTSAQAATLPNHAPKPGGIAVIEVSRDANAPTVVFEGRRALLLQEQDIWYAVVGIQLNHALGNASISVRKNDRPDRIIEFEIVAFAYREQHLKVARNYVEPDEDTLERIIGERKIIDAALYHWEDTAVDSLSLATPVEGPRNNSFGSRRFFNEQPRSPHSGMDIAANQGTTVIAPLAGVVTATGHYFFNGNTVIVDHGQGFVTMYCHLDRIDVAEGDVVDLATPLGIVGATGRVTGPHLHFGSYLGGTAVDPALVLPVTE